MTDQGFYRHALEVQQRELGVDGLARFLRLNRYVGGDYTRDHEQSLDNLGLADVLESTSTNRHRER